MMFHGVLVTIWILSYVTLAKHEQPPVRDCGGQHVCTTLMRYRDGTTVNEGDNCHCREGVSACNKEWDEGLGDNSLTWQHYERAHWTVQYRFCTPVFQDKNICTGDELAAVVETDIKKWEPLVDEPRCVCGTAVNFKIMGWKRVGQKWKYYYKCEKEECRNPTPENEKVPCARIDIDPGKKADKVLEVKFLCNCPDGFMCPTKFNEKADIVISDEIGNYVIKNCEPTTKGKISLNDS